MEQLKAKILNLFENLDTELTIGYVYQSFPDEDPNELQKAFWQLHDDADIQITPKKTFKRTR